MIIFLSCQQYNLFIRNNHTLIAYIITSKNLIKGLKQFFLIVESKNLV